MGELEGGGEAGLLSMETLKAEASKLMEKRAGIEAEIEVIAGRLCGPKGPGVRESLVDKEGFPRADIDIPMARADRHRLAVLHADHKELTRSLEAIILSIHENHRRSAAVGVDSKGTSHQGNGPEEHPSEPISSHHQSAAASSQVQPSSSSISTNPFAVIDSVNAESPAELDGIVEGDLLLRFGSVADGQDCVARISKELQASEGSRVEVVVERRGAEVAFFVTPRKWSGRGLLGCHMCPL